MLEFIMNHWLLLVCLFIYVVSAILLIDISYWELKQTYLHWKKEQKFANHVKEEWKWTLFKKDYSFGQAIIFSLIPIINTFTYIYTVIANMKEQFKFSDNYILQDMVKWKKGINAFIWQKWVPSISWRIRYPII